MPKITRVCTVCGLRWQVGRYIPVRGGKYECPKCERARLLKEKKAREATGNA